MLVKNAAQRLEGEKELYELIPGFDWFELSGILSVDLKFNPSSDGEPLYGFNVDVVAAYGKELTIGFRLVDVRRLVLPEVVWPGGLDFGELEIVDVRHRQMEGVVYMLHDAGAGGFRAECRDVVILSVSQRMQDGLVERWRNGSVLQ